MKTFVVLFVLLSMWQILASSANTYNTYHNIQNKILKEFCPFVDFKGTFSGCAKNKMDNNVVKLPIIIGGGYNRATNNIALPFLNITYNKQIQFKTNSGKVFLIPDQISFTEENYSNAIFSTKLYDNIQQYLLDYDINSENINSNGFTFDEIDELLNYFGNYQFSFGVSLEYRYAYHLTIPTNVGILPEVQEAINFLPHQYDPVIYNEFIEYWGTDIIIDLYAGSLAQETSIVKNCYGGVNTLNDVELYLLKNLYVDQYQHVNFDTGFTEYSQASIVNLYGGNPIYVSPSDWPSRVITLQDYPVVIQIKTVPLINFIADPTIRNNLNTAIVSYVAQTQNFVTNAINVWETQLKKNIYYRVVGMGLPNSNYASQEVCEYCDIYSADNTFEVSINQEISPNYFTWPYRPDIILGAYAKCGLDVSGKVYSIFDTSVDSLIRVTSVSVPEGQHVRFGCSYSEAYYETPFLFSPTRAYCCINCLPTYYPPYITYYYDGHSSDDHFGKFECLCEPF